VVDFGSLQYYIREIEGCKPITRDRGGHKMQIDNRTILYKLVEEFGLKRDSTEERLKLQKTIYLLQAYGLKLGYGFSWYRYGPYSQDLVYDAYTVLGTERPKYEQAVRTWRFSENCLQKFNEFKEVCGDILRSAEQLELVASIDFVCNTWYPDGERSQIVGLLKKHKRQFFNGRLIPDDTILQAFDIRNRLRKN